MRSKLLFCVLGLLGGATHAQINPVVPSPSSSDSAPTPSPTQLALPLPLTARKATSSASPPPATDFRSVAMACANTGNESQEAFDQCMKTSLIAQPGVPQTMQDSRKVPSPGLVYAPEVNKAAPDSNEPTNFFSYPTR